jgi:hypothetical protein
MLDRLERDRARQQRQARAAVGWIGKSVRSCARVGLYPFNHPYAACEVADLPLRWWATSKAATHHAPEPGFQADAVWLIPRMIARLPKETTPEQGVAGAVSPGLMLGWQPSIVLIVSLQSRRGQ